MSIPQIFLTASGSSMPTTTTNVSTSRRMPSLDSSSNSKEHIRERLNLHVKKRIQGHDIGHYSMPSASPSPPTSLYSATNAHPFLMTGASVSMPSVMVFANSLITVASNYGNDVGRTIAMPQIERQLPKMKQLPKKVTKKKRGAGMKKKTKHMDTNQQPENLILNGKFSDDSNDYHDRNDNSFNSSISPQASNGDSPTCDRPDAKVSNTPDILSMVLSLKKNAMMHDPYVIQFISAIR